jgi:hypothetical protein
MRGKLTVTTSSEVVDMFKYTFENPYLTTDPNECSLMEVTRDGPDIHIESGGDLYKDHPYVKYLEQPGFHDIENSRWMFGISEERLRNTLTALRIIKYKKRGFNITF